MDGKRLSYLAVVALLTALVFYSFSPPGWEKQYRVTGEALEKAMSYRISITTRGKDGDTFELEREANCPADYHSLQRHYAKDGSLIPQEDIEVWSLGKTHVLRQNNTLMNASFGPPQCGDQHLLELGTLPSSKIILMHGHAVRGSKKTIDGLTCRLWTVQMPAGDGWGDLYTMCVDDNNLPLEVVTTNGTVAHASHWNEKIELPEPPEVPQAGRQN